MDKKAYTRVTIVDIAQEAGVSPKTVSRVIRGDRYVHRETRERVQQVIDRSAYRPNRAARSLVSNRTNVIGVVIPDIRNPFFAEIVRGIEDTGLQHGYNFLLFSTDGDPERERNAYQYLEENGVDGIIVDLPCLPVLELEALLRRQNAAILIDHPLIEGATGVIRIDFYDAAVKATRHLVMADRHEIGYLSPPGQYVSFTERVRGIFEEAARHHIDVRPRHIAHCEPDIEDSFRAARTLLLENPEINGLICFNDMIGLGALEACDNLGIKVPDQLAIIAFDDIYLARLNRIGLTTLSIPKREIGIQAVQMLLDRENGETPPSEVVIKGDIVHRKTTPIVDMRN